MSTIPRPEWSATRVGYPLDRTLHSWIEAQADRSPDAVAVLAEEGRLTYAELEARANQLARHLRGLGVGPETRVGICAERSLDLVVGLVGILKSGGAYVPLDPGYPRERLSYLLEDSAVPVLLTQERLEERLPASLALRVRLDEDWKESPERPEPLSGPDHLAYVIYTSGSTGRPKGAMNAHRGICNRLLWMQDAYGIGPDDRVLQKTPFSFDVSVWEFFWPLMTGARLVMARPGGHQDAAYLADLIVREGVTTLHFVPPMLRAFLEEPRAGDCAGTLKRVICSGEALPMDVQRRFFARLPGVELHNLYGPTEAAVDVTWWPCDPASTLATVPIGRPVANTRIHLLDPELQPVPVGEAGELYIGGVQVGRGYLNRPELTAERFVPDPFEPGARFYRTGDLARHLPDGAIEFLGRIDFQVKIRGFRIELGEIEAALDEHPGVEGSVVVAADGPGGDKRLVAYLRPDHNRAAAVRRWLGLEREGRLEGQSFHELPDGTVVAHRGAGETGFLWEEIFADRSYLRHGIGLRDGDCVFDVGANIGLFSLFASREAAVRIHAFEPVPPVFETLSVNAGLHGLDVRLHDCGLAGRPGSAELTYYPHASLISGRFADAAEEREVVRGFLLGQKEEAGISEREIEELLDERLQAERHTCRLRTLSEVIAGEGIERIDLLKVDVEKSEMEVLAGLRDEDWPRVRQVVVEVHDIDGRLEQALDLLRRQGFEVAVEQDRMLTRTGLYNLYARRPGEEKLPGEARCPAQAWTSPGQLIRDVRESLRERLPEPMVPAAFVLLEDFPLSPNGKVDRKALPAPESVRHAAEREHVAPTTPTEETLAAIWSEILGTERIGTEDSFLDLGGHSLLATQVIARVRDGMGVELSLRDVFERPVLSALAARIEERGLAGAASSPIVAVPRTGDLPLSFPQERVWFLQQLDPTIQSYQFQARIRFRGGLDPDSLRRSLEEIVRRHEIFRTSYPTVDGGPVQRFHPAWEVPLPQVDLSGLPAERREAESGRVLALECRKLFDIARLPLVRWTLIRLAPEEHVWLHVEHHLVHDGWSFNRLVGELSVLYRAFAEGRPSPLPDLPLQFADWAVWHREWMRGEEAAAQIEWWKRTLAGRPLVLELPADRPRPKRQSFRGTVERLEMPLDLCESLRAASRREGVSLFMLMQAAFAALLSRWSGQEQINVGAAVANRRWRETESMIGMIVDNVVLTNDLSGDPGMTELLQRVRRVCLDAGIRQDVPFDHVVKAVQPERDFAYNPLFQACFSFHDSPLDELDFPRLEAELAEGLSNGSAKFDLNVICIPRSEQRRQAGPGGGGGGITLLWEYATALFDRSTMLRMIDHFHRLLGCFASDPKRRLSDLPLLAAAESQQLLREWNDTGTTYPEALCLHELIAAQAARSPERVAVAFEGESLTYARLEAAAGCLARHLAGLGVGPEVPVGICAERSLDLMVGLLAILKSGGAYLPLDPAYPADRLAWMLEDSGAPVLLVQERLLGRLPEHAVAVVLLDGRATRESDEPRPGNHSRPLPDNLAYVIYTSGSTGRPKGTMNAHRGIVNRLLWMQERFGLAPDDTVLQKTPFSFDVSVWELFWPLLVGARLVMARPGGHQDPSYLVDTITGQGITTLHFVPSMLQAFLEAPGVEKCAPLARVVCSGEALPAELERRFYARMPAEAGLYNLYGPTEAAVDVTHWTCERESRRMAVPIGVPVANTRIHLLDRSLRPVPAGVSGELYIGGVQVGRGYLNRPGLTAERFVPDPFEPSDPGGRLYRTGDLARHLPGGAVEFLGRIDFQVKIRGFRIELGEIEAALDEHPGVEGSVVTATGGPGNTGDTGDNQRLVAYLRPGHARGAAVRRWLGLEREGRLEGQSFHELPDGTVIAHRGRGETEFLWEEIFADRTYLRHGIELRDGDCVFDVGANVGLFSLFAGREAAVRLHAFEPIPPLFEILGINARLHGLDVRLHDCGLADRPGSAEFTYYPHASLISGRFADAAMERDVVRSFLLDQKEAEVSERQIEELLDERLQAERHVCRLRTLSEILDEEGIERIDLLKVDVEKSELEVLAGLRDEDWPKVRQVVVEVHELDGRLPRALELLRRQGFEVAVEQDRMLTKTGLYNLYARRPAAAPRPAAEPRQRERSWTSPGQLIRDVTDRLRERLPEHMVPAAIVLLEELPLTPNGKVDRNALPSPESVRHAAEREHVAPRTPTEEALAGIWREILDAERIGAHDSFFALGGHSLLATRVVSRVRAVFGLELPLHTLFERPMLAELAEAVDAARRAGPGLEAPPLVATERPPGDQPDLPLSFAQERLWFLHQFGTHAAEMGIYNIPEAYRLEGRLDVPALERSFNEVVRRHEALRTTFTVEGGRVLQSIAPALHLDLSMVDLRMLEGKEAEAHRLAGAEAALPFDLARGPLIRTVLLRLAPEEHVLLLTQHHIVSDGWSMGIFVRELAALYQAFGEGAPSPLPELPIQYADFARWQRAWLRGEVLARQLAYWKERMEGAPALLELPADRPRPSVQTFRGADRTLTISAGLGRRLEELSRTQGASLFMTLFAAFQLLLSRYTGREDVVAGTPIANRNRYEIEGLIGFFVNTLVLRTDLSGDPTFPELLRRVRDVSLDAYAHQDVPFEKLVEELRPERNLAHAPLFQVLFALHNAPSMELELPGLTLSRLEPEGRTAKFDLAFHVQPQRNGDLRTLARFNRDLFDGTTMDRLLRCFRNLLEAVAADPGARLSELPMLEESERRQMLAEWNDTEAAFPECALHEPFEIQARRNPEAPALEFDGKAMTYGELDRRAGQLARRLAALGSGPGGLVGIHLDRSFDMVVAVLGVLKSGAAYVPLEISWPRERLRWILSVQGIDHVVTHSGVELPAGRAVCLDEPGAEMSVTRRAGPDDLAYIIFTSGSTGAPKGVMVRHRPAVNLVHWVNTTFDIGPADRLLFITALSFDLSVYDVFGILAAGGTVRIASRTEGRDPQRLVRILVEEGITFWDSAPAALQQLVPFFPSPGSVETSLRRVFLSGDWIPVTLPDRVRESFPGARVTSLGGATEATVWSNYYPVGEVDPAWKSIPYGRPIANARYHVLDAALAPCPIGVPGDLYISGPCLSLGYAKAPDLTADRYVPDPVGPEPGGRLYRTGDRARYWTDGTLEFLGRLDSQVKVRGYRIELGEIEAVLASHPGVREAVALVREDVPGDQRLVAYLIPEREEEPPSAGDLRSWSAERLPEYMMPAAFVAMTAWPLSPTGKLDRKSLPPPFAPKPTQPIAAVSAAPRTEMERVIAAVWREVIGVESVGVDDNFFDLGGHSLLLAQVQVRLSEILGRNLPMVDLFRYPTVGALAEALSSEEPALTEVVPARRTHDRIAVVGMAGRFPGARDVDELWRNLRDGVESIRFFTDEELFAAGVHPDLLADPAYVKARGVLEGTDLFDAGLFECTPREAQVLDPQQRLFLENAWQALEHAGYGGERWRGEVGVFAGASENTYVHQILANPALLSAVGRYSVSLANNPDYLATRVSYKLNLQGPGLSVQTACSTSLVAVHLACRALLEGECDLAVAGGASVRVPEQAGYLHEEGGIASPDGHTRTFDARAAGTVRSSGVGAVVLRRLEDALADGDTVHAVILGSAVNNDGSLKVGFTAPAVEGQARVIRKAHLAAGADPGTIGYVEAHGTGTALGDPVEIAGLTEAFRDGGAQGTGFCAVGSVKSNLGHLDAAAGIAGLLKTVLALEHGQIPPSLHYESPNPAIDFGSSPFYVAAELKDWTSPRRAGVSSFGIGGTNAHVVLEEAPPPAPAREARPAHLLVLSAATPSALEMATDNLARNLPEDLADLADAAWTLQVGRKPLRCRRAVVCRNREEAAEELLRGNISSGIVPAEPLSVAFLFPGQGAQHVGMAEELYAHEPVFREALEEACELLRPELGLDLRELLYPLEGEPSLDDTALAQPALFAVEHALARLWISWGVKPEAMLGHSVGEYVAACLAGIFSLEDGLRLVAARGRLMQEQPPGAMLAVPLPEFEVAPLLGPLSLAAVNAPAACVVSGTPEDVRAFRERLGEEVDSRVLHTSHAFHSAMMDPVLEPFAQLLRGMELRPPRIPFVSNRTGTWITADEAVSPDYWAGHLRGTVRFADGLGTLLGQGRRTALLEVGPGGTLSTLAATRSTDLVARSLRRPKEDRRDLDVLLGALGRLWLAGADVDWSAVHAGERRRRIPLPTYPFERRSYWVDATPMAQRLEAEAEPIVGQVVPMGAALAGVRTSLEETVARVWSELLGLDQFSLHDDFFDLGGSSLVGLQMSSRLRRALGVSVSGDLLLEAPTVSSMAKLLESRLASPETAPVRPTCLVRLQPGGDRPPLFLVHQVGGYAYTFRALSRELGNDRPVYGLRSQGLEEGEEPLRTVEEMAGHYLGLVREAQPRGPYLLGGASMGGMVAFEMAHQLQSAGEDIALLALMDTPCLDQMPVREGHAEAVAAVFRGRVDLCPDELRPLAPEEQLALAFEKARQAGNDGLDPAEITRRVRVLASNVDALYGYAPRPHPGSMVYFRAETRRPGDPLRPELPWIELLRGGTEVHLVPGDHMTMHEPPHVRTLAERLRRCLGRVVEARVAQPARYLESR